MPIMEQDEILKTLPHRYPFLLVDRVLECDFKERIVGLKNLTCNEPFFQGHFPQKAVMPGVLQLEAMAQLGGILLNKVCNRQGMISFFTGIDEARFRRVLVPGDQLIMEVVVEKIRLGSAKVRGTVRVDGQVACEATMMFRMGDV